MKLLPSDIEAEQSILGACMIDQNSVIEAMEVLINDDFYREDNKIIFKCIESLFSRNEPIDVITLKNELDSIGKLEHVGGLEYVASLPDKVPTIANINKYINIVKEKSIKRNLIEYSNEISTLSFNPEVSTDKLSQTAEEKIFKILQRKDLKGVSNLKDLMIESINELQEVCKNGKRKGIPTGFISIDKRMGGLKGSELIIIAARPGMGKSAFALNIATNVAKKEKVPVLIFNLEMGKKQLTDRILCSECLIDAVKYRDGKLNEDEWVQLVNGINILSDAKIFIDDNASITISEIMSKCRKMKIEENIGLVIIDYLQLITPSEGKQSREQEVAQISRTLKVMAKELDIPVIALSQLSRANEKRGNKERRPMLSDLRDSGNIEQDADIVLFIHRDDYYGIDTVNKNIAEINFAKFRSGETGIEKLAWVGKNTKFADIIFDK